MKGVRTQLIPGFGNFDKIIFLHQVNKQNDQYRFPFSNYYMYNNTTRYALIRAER